jgi:arginase
MIELLAAPSPLGLRPPEPGSVPGTAKAPEALREAGLYRDLASAGAVDGGVVLPGRYRDDWRPGDGRLRNQEALLEHSGRLAERIRAVLAKGSTPLVLGGDCSLLIAAGQALARRGGYGLLHIDGHTDFRHPGNSDECASLAGEDLAAAIGLHWPAVADIDGRGPYFDPACVAQLGCRIDDEHLDEVSTTVGLVITADDIARDPARAARAARETVDRAPNGYWIHLDVDVLDPAVMAAVDSPAPGGLQPAQLVTMLGLLAPGAAGAQVTVLDPDLDPDGSCAATTCHVVVRGLAPLGGQQTTSDQEAGARRH